MTKETVVNAISVCARKLKRNPSLRELRVMAGVPEKAVYRRVGGLRKAFELAGLQEAIGPGFKPAERAMLLDWARVARKLKKLPTVMEYNRVGRYSFKPFHTRYGHWSEVPEAFRDFAGAPQNRGLRRDWRDVLEMIASTAAGAPGKAGRGGDAGATLHFRTGGVMQDRPVYGRPLGWPEMAHAPVNELGVIYAFGAMARRLRFIVYRIQPGFPDCEALREVAPGQWQLVRIEFEFESRNFLKHRHRHDRCDIIVCWKHNWKECPLEVVELGKMEEQPAISNWQLAKPKPATETQRHGGRMACRGKAARAKKCRVPARGRHSL